MFIVQGVNYGRDLNANVSKNFKFWELVSSEKAMTLGIANVPTEAEWKNLEILVAKVLQPLRDKLGPLKVNSAFRCKKLNDAVGSSDRSFHRLGCAVDVEPAEGSLVTLMALLEEAHKLPEWSEMIAEYFPNGWVHIGCKLGDNRKVLKLKDPANDYLRIALSTLKAKYA